MRNKHAIARLRAERLLEPTRHFGLHVKIEEEPKGTFRIFERESIRDEWTETESGQRRNMTRLAIQLADKWSAV